MISFGNVFKRFLVFDVLHNEKVIVLGFENDISVCVNSFNFVSLDDKQPVCDFLYIHSLLA